MCGIALVCSMAGGLKPSAISDAIRCLRRRGPDGAGSYVDEHQRLVMGHTRLAVMDPEFGAQPLLSQDGALAVAANGEIYGAELRRELRALGADFRTASDSEILLHAYQRWGSAAFERLNAELCATLWDAQRGQLWAYRDRYGARSLVYQLDAGVLRIASTVEALFALGAPRAWDEEAMSQALAMQYLAPERTPFRGVYMLPPGYTLCFDQRGLRLTPWGGADWDAPSAEMWATQGGSLESSVERFRAAFLDAVERRLLSDAELCFHLSGGVDSAAVLAAAAYLQREKRSAPRQLHAYTASFPGSDLDELKLARLSAERAGATLHVVPITPLEIVERLGAASQAGEGLAVNGHLVAHFELDRAISEAGFKSVLSGEGADELLSGYPHLRADLAASQGKPFEHQGNVDLGGIMLALPPGSATGVDAVGQPQRAARQLSAASALSSLGFVPNFVAAKLSLGSRLLSLSSSAAWQQRSQGAFDAFFSSQAVTALRGRQPVDISQTLWTQLALGGYILPTLSDRVLGYHGLESRLPFLDADLYQVARRLPLDQRIRDVGGVPVEKWILREALRGLVPNPIRTRTKHPFLAPGLTQCPRARRALADLLTPSTFSARTFFDPTRVAQSLSDLAGAPRAEHSAWGPPLFLIASAHALGQAFGLE